MRSRTTQQTKDVKGKQQKRKLTDIHRLRRAAEAIKPDLTKIGRDSVELLANVAKQPGVYIITSYSNYCMAYMKNTERPATEEMFVKIGLAQDMNHRLNSYLLYWPAGITAFSIFQTGTLKDAQTLEKNIHKYLVAKKRHVVSEHTHTDEWFSLTMQEISNLIQTIIAARDIQMENARVFPFQQHVAANQFISATLTKHRKHVRASRIAPMDPELKSRIDQVYNAKIAQSDPVHPDNLKLLSIGKPVTSFGRYMDGMKKSSKAMESTVRSLNMDV